MPSTFGPIAVNVNTGALEYAAETVTQAELDTHAADGDPHTGYLLETAAILPQHYGYKGWAFDPAAAQNETNGAAGYIFMSRVIASVSGTVTKVVFDLSTAGATLTVGQCFAGVYSTAGTRLATSTDQAAAWEAANVSEATMAASFSVVAGTAYFVALLANGSTTPKFRRGAFSDPGTTLYNKGLSAGNLRFAHDGVGSRTSLPSSLTAASFTGSQFAFWAALL